MQSNRLLDAFRFFKSVEFSLESIKIFTKLTNLAPLCIDLHEIVKHDMYTSMAPAIHVT